MFPKLFTFHSPESKVLSILLYFLPQLMHFSNFYAVLVSSLFFFCLSHSLCHESLFCLLPKYLLIPSTSSSLGNCIHWDPHHHSSRLAIIIKLVDLHWVFQIYPPHCHQLIFLKCNLYHIISLFKIFQDLFIPYKLNDLTWHMRPITCLLPLF